MPKWLNKAAALSLCGALALVACGGDSPVVSTGRAGKGGVAIPDAKLHAAIASALGKASNALVTADGMATLTRLDAPNSGIRDLTGLEFATSLTRLNLGIDKVEDKYVNSNDISDLTPLTELTNLTRLSLGDNSIADLTPLTGLTNLTTLWLDDNSISDLTPLAGLTNLATLWLDDNSIADLTPLAGLTNLTWLTLTNTNVPDLTPLAGLTNLTDLSLGDNSIADLSPLAGLTSLIWLSLYNNSLSDLTPLAGLTSLIWLRLDDNSISDLTPLAGLTNLTELRLENNNISDIAALASLTSLIRLYLNANSIADLTPLTGLTNLTTLWLGDNSISDLTPLAGLTNLTELRLENNNISDIAPLVENTGLGIGNWIDVRGNPLSDTSINAHIPALQARGVISDDDGGETPVAIPDAKLHAAIANELGKASNAPITASEMATLNHLFAFDSDIRELTGLEYAINLTTLQLGRNDVSDLTPLTGLTNLTALYLYGNRISNSNLTHLAGLTNLTTLELGFNGVSDLTPLAGLTNLTELEIEVNAITDLTPLAGLTNLITLELGFNEISDLTPLAGLTNLTELEIEDNAITDLTPLTGLTNLITLKLGDNSISELPVGVFAGFANLKTLNLARNPGAPFAFTLELERTDTANRLAPSPADVAVQLAEGAPFEIAVALSVHNGSASVASLIIDAGDTASAPAHVTATSGPSTATHVVLDHVPQIPNGFTGVEVRTGSPLVLFAESDDHFPVAEGEIPPHILQVGGPKPALDVTKYFSDADGDELVYSVTSDDDHLVGNRVNAGVITLIPRAEGYASVVVTATDSNGWSASQALAITVLPAPDPRSFDIDLVFVGPVTADTRSATLQMAKRWTEVITGDLPDVPVPDKSVQCILAEPVEHRFFGTVDDLVVFAEVAPLTRAWGYGNLCGWRDGSSLPYMGYIILDTEIAARGGESLAGVILHEIGHALGFGSLWNHLGFLQDSGGADPHFNGPLAIEAFDAAGGTNYTAGAKVPVDAYETHWRFGGELMGAGGSALSAITVQSLADLGYVVDVSQADPFQLPSSAKAVADKGLDLRNDILQGPIRVADENGHIVRVIRP